ncbi:uncharacterized protein [Dermacentor andersoni]|uniref:uncharacterized protein isoform X2 n=1 Tax=Dermacentor andersoni TaxID=34620 RepID=UPI0024179310|nr:uncharacterized protein LOC126541550 isoform X2 [Dermacentor andersoni]
MHEFTTGLLLLVAALNWGNEISLATPYIKDHGLYSNVTLEPQNTSGGSSEGEDDDWEEHHEWTYTELDDEEESGEGSAVGANTSSSGGTRANMNKEKRKVLASNQQTSIKHSKQQKRTSYANKTSTKAFASTAQKLTTKSPRANFAHVGNQRLDRPAKSPRKSPKTTVPLRYKRNEARYFKWSDQSGRKLTTASVLNSRKHKRGKEIQGKVSKGARKKSSSTTTGNNSSSKKYARNNTEGSKQSVTANWKLKVAGAFTSKRSKNVRTYPKEAHHGSSKSSRLINFTGSSNNGRAFESSSSNSTGRNRTGSSKVKRAAAKTSTEAIATKRYRGKIENMSARGATHAGRNQLDSRFTVGSTSTLSDFQSLKTTRNNVYKRNHVASSKLVTSETLKSDDNKSMKKLVTQASQQARGNLSSKSNAGSANTQLGSRRKTRRSGNVLVDRPNANQRLVSSNYKGNDAKSKLRTVAKKTLSKITAAANALFGLKQPQTKPSPQRSTRHTSVSSWEGDSHVRSHVFGTSSGGKLSRVVDSNGSNGRRVGHNTSAGAITDIRGTRHRTYLPYNGSSWSGLGGALGDNLGSGLGSGVRLGRRLGSGLGGALGSKRSWDRYLAGSRKRRKKGRSIFRARRILRRRRKRRGRRKTLAQPQVEITKARDKEQASSRDKLVAGAQIRPIKTVTPGSSSTVKQALQAPLHNDRSYGAELSAVTSYVNRSRIQAHKPPKITALAVLPLEPPNTRKAEASAAERITTPRKRLKESGIHSPQNENTYVLRRKNLQTQKVHANNVTSAQHKRLHLQISPDGSASAILPDMNIAKQSRDEEETGLVRRHRKRLRAHRHLRCRSSPAALTGETGNFVGGGLMWFPAASCVASGLDWNSVHSTACLHQQIAFVHRYKILAPALPSINESYTPGFCGSYVPWSHVTPHHVTDLLYDGSIVSGLSLHRFGFINPGGYTFEVLPHTGWFILVGVPFHRRTLSLCNLKPTTLGLLFTGTGLRDGSRGMQRFGQICSTLEDYAKTNPNNLYWGFPTVPVKTMTVAVRVPEKSTDATITPVLPIASESAEAFTQKVFTEPLALYPDTPVDYSEAHTDFLEPVVFLTNSIEHDDDAIDEDVVPPTFVEEVAAPVVEGAAEAVAVVAENDDMIETQNSVEVPIFENEQNDVTSGPEMAVDGLSANVPTEDVYDGIDGKADYISYDARLDLDDVDPAYYQDAAEPVVHVTEQMLLFPAPSL